MSDKNSSSFASQFTGEEIDKEIKYIQTVVHKKIPEIEQSLSNKINEKLAVKAHERNKPNGYAGLDSSGKIDSSLLPESYNPSPSDPSAPTIEDNSFVINFNNNQVGDRTYNEILDAVNQNKNIIGKFESSANKSLYFSFVQVNSLKISLATITGGDKHCIYECWNPEWNIDKEWSYQIIDLVEENTFNEFKAEANSKFKELENNRGEDGFSPTVIVEQTDDGAIIIITDKNGTTTSVINDGYSPVRGTDYWTEEDIAEIKTYVDEAILGGEW